MDKPMFIANVSKAKYNVSKILIYGDPVIFNKNTI